MGIYVVSFPKDTQYAKGGKLSEQSIVKLLAVVQITFASCELG